MKNRLYKGIVSFIASFTMLANMYTPVFASPVSQGSGLGAVVNQLIINKITGGTVDLPSPGGANEQTTQELQDFYPGSGRDDGESIQALHQAGMSFMATEECEEDDYACKGRKGVYDKEPVNDRDFTAWATDARATAASRDPYEVLGIGRPNISGGGQICETTTVQTPGRTERQTCFESVYRVVAEPVKLPTTVDYSYTSPYCIDPTFDLLPDQSSCEKTTYHCRVGDTLKGMSCKGLRDRVEVPKEYIYTSITIGIEYNSTARGDADRFRVTSTTFGSPFGWTGGLNASGSAGVQTIFRNLGIDARGITSASTSALQSFLSRAWGSYPDCRSVLCGRTHKTTLTLNADVKQCGPQTIQKGNLCYGCPEGTIPDPLGGEMCVDSYPATAQLHEATPGCMGGAIYSAGQEVTSDPSFVPGEATGGSWTCQTEHYSCPAGLAMNGRMCEDVDRIQYLANPNCVNLGHNPASGVEGFLCTYHDESSCAPYEDKCTLIEEECKEVDEVIGSPTEGQCIGKLKQYECPIPGSTVTTEVCGFEPTCINGHCFEEEPHHCEVSNPEDAIPAIHSIETCDLNYVEEYHSCDVQYIYGPPDEKGEQHIIGGKPKDSCAYTNKSSCTQLPFQVQADEITKKSYWPEEVTFSCLTGETFDTCDNSLTHNPNCKKISEETTLRQFGSFEPGVENSIGGVESDYLPTRVTKTFECSKPVSMTQSSCTSDFAAAFVGMEMARQAGSYMLEDLMMFKGEEHRCHKRKGGFAGSAIGSKDCCRAKTPDPDSNANILGGDFDGKNQLMSAGITTASNYAYDFMMNSDAFYEFGASLWENGIATDSWANDLGSADYAANGVTLLSYAGVGLSYGGAATGFTGMTSTSSWALGNSGFNIQFSPAAFYIYAALELFKAWQAQLACTDEDYKTSMLNRGKLCYTIDGYCSKKESGIFGSTCYEHRTVNCCYNSKLSRIVNQQARWQSHITPKIDPKSCEGFDLHQFEQIDWSRIDLSEFLNDVLNDAKGNLPSQQSIDEVSNKIKNNVSKSATESMGQPIDRLNHHP